MKRYRQRILLLLVAGLAAAGAALDWPIAPVRVAGEFGTPLEGSPMPGLLFAGEELAARTAGKGDVSFHREAIDPRTKLPSALGAMMVNEGDDGLAEVYALLPTVVGGAGPGAMQGAFVAKTGQAGISGFKGFWFALFDRKMDRWVNPRLFMPELQDKKAPGIRKVSLVENDKSYSLGETRSLPQGSYALVVETTEVVGADGESIQGPPYFIRILVNGESQVELRAEVASTVDGRLSFYPDRKKGADMIDGRGALRLEPRMFTRGRTSIEILIRDFSGNERSAGWTLIVE